MKKISMIGYQVHEVSFSHRLQPGTKIQFENGYAYNAKYSNSNLCHGEMKITVCDKEDKTRFSLSVTVAGMFHFDASMEKEEVHATTFKQLFPYARTYISMMTAAAGIAPVMIPDIDIDDKTVYRVELNPDRS